MKRGRRRAGRAQLGLSDHDHVESVQRVAVRAGLDLGEARGRERDHALGGGQIHLDALAPLLLLVVLLLLGVVLDRRELERRAVDRRVDGRLEVDRGRVTRPQHAPAVHEHAVRNRAQTERGGRRRLIGAGWPEEDMREIAKC